MTLRDQTEYAGRHFEVTWISGQDLPLRDKTTQVSSVCFTPNNQIVLISDDGNKWNIPGGHPEPGESLEDALRRELWEEACCKIIKLSLLGWQQVKDLHDSSVHYQMRYACSVDIKPFVANHEISHRRLIGPGEFLQTLEYGHSPLAKELLKLATEANQRMKSSEQGAQPDAFGAG